MTGYESQSYTKPPLRSSLAEIFTFSAIGTVFWAGFGSIVQPETLTLPFTAVATTGNFICATAAQAMYEYLDGPTKNGHDNTNRLCLGVACGFTGTMTALATLSPAV